MSVMPHDTCEQRRICAEWIVDGILDAMVECVGKAMDLELEEAGQ